MPDTRRFSIVTPRTNEPVHGLAGLAQDHAYLRIYPARVNGEKPIDTLQPGESSLHRFHLGGAPEIYAIVRTE